MKRTFYIPSHQEQIMFDFVELVEKQQAQAKKNGQKPKSYSTILVEYMDYYTKKHKAK
jgi:hypothetical protein